MKNKRMWISAVVIVALLGLTMMMGCHGDHASKCCSSDPSKCCGMAKKCSTECAKTCSAEDAKKCCSSDPSKCCGAKKTQGGCTAEKVVNP